MDRFDTIEMLAFKLKMLGSKSRKRILISAGKIEDKRRMLPAIERLSRLQVTIFATRGTSDFLRAHGIPNQLLYKINEKAEPNIKSALDEDRLDLIVNVLTGQNDYDESSDNNLIRTLAIQHGIPLVTDPDIAILTIDQIVQGASVPVTPSRPEPWNLKAEFFRLVEELGGFASYHAHFDKAYLISMENLKLGQVDMQKKWELYKYLKENYTHDDLVTRISRGVEAMIAQGVTYCRTMVDADSTVKLLPMKAALEVKERYRDRIHLEIGTQPLQGVIDPESRQWYVKASELADTMGGLPSKDRPRPEKHIDILMDIAKDLGKKLEVHVDQENNPYESETEMLALKAIEHGLEGRVAAVHAISMASKPRIEQERIIRTMKEAGLSVIVCPSAALSMKQLDMPGPLHNSIAPFTLLLDSGVPTYLGVDNIADLFMPIVDGDMWFECRMLMEATRFYDIEKVAQVACDKSWFNLDAPARLPEAAVAGYNTGP
jgi:cytosine/adenosine deaminase-related metal-dependent hydrolase